MTRNMVKTKIFFQQYLHCILYCKIALQIVTEMTITYLTQVKKDKEPRESGASMAYGF